MTALLSCRDLAAGYGPVKIVQPTDLDVAAGSVYAILGPNGSGKTTLMLTMAGLLPRQGGTVSVDGNVLRSGRAAAARRAGVVLVPDDRSLFGSLTVRENLQVATRRKSQSIDDVVDLFPALRQRFRVAAGMLSGGEQQMLAVARALVQRPRILLIDEMSMGLAPIIVETLLPIVRRIADDTGTAVVLVEQHIGLALEVADEALVLVHGSVALRGAARQLAADPTSLEAAYLGEVMLQP
jgi:branched-chain amino acid transport system ATP-binding protein